MSKIDKNQVRLSLLRNKFINDRDKLNDLSEFAERSLIKESQRWSEQAEQEISKLTDEFDRTFLAECYAEDISNFDTLFPQIQRYALFTHTMALAETNMVRLCQVVQKLFQGLPEFDDKKSGVILRGVEYISQHASSEAIRFGMEVDLVGNLVKIRNRVVHSEGIVKGKPNEKVIREFVLEIPSLSIDLHHKIIMEKGFVHVAIHATHELLISLHDLVRKAAQQ